MMDLETIKDLNKKAGRNAKKKKIMPLVFDAIEMHQLNKGDITPIRSMPDLGDSIPEGWNRFNLSKIKKDFTYDYKIYSDDNKGAGAFFVDQGMGSDNEPAMTVPQFIKSLSELWNKNDKLGYAIVETGQFQVKIGVFEDKPLLIPMTEEEEYKNAGITKEEATK